MPREGKSSACRIISPLVQTRREDGGRRVEIKANMGSVFFFFIIITALARWGSVAAKRMGGGKDV